MNSSTTPNSNFYNLINTFTIHVQKAETRPLNVPLKAPFTIATSKLDKVKNVGIRIELKDGCVGWGEAPILPSVTSEDQPLALDMAAKACMLLKDISPIGLSLGLEWIDGVLHGHEFASVRSGVEMALLDAVAKNEASKLALQYREQGFKTLKCKVGKNLDADIEVLRTIRKVYPGCHFILDANEGYTPKEAVEVLHKLHSMDITPILFEQPVHRDDWEGLGYVNRIAREKYEISVAADESCRSLADAKKIVEENLAGVINIKLAKLGVLGALQVIELVRASKSDLMIGGMVETRLAMGFAGHLAAGMGCFKFVDLDTPLLLSEDPVFGGYEVFGAVYKFTDDSGHGGFLQWDNVE